MFSSDHPRLGLRFWGTGRDVVTLETPGAVFCFDAIIRLFKPLLACSLTGLRKGQERGDPGNAVFQETKMSFIRSRVIQQEHTRTCAPRLACFFPQLSPALELASFLIRLLEWRAGGSEADRLGAWGWEQPLVVSGLSLS